MVSLRLIRALVEAGIDARMLVTHPTLTDEPLVGELGCPRANKLRFIEIGRASCRERV